MSDSHLVVGLDSGGSKTLLRGEYVGNSTSVERRGEGANPNRIGLDRATEVLVDLVRAAAEEGPPVHQLSICAGVSGAGRPDEQDAFAEAFRAAFNGSTPTVQVEVVHDALIALDAAYNDGSGVVLIAGTGSVVLGRSRDGTLLRAGGWGHLLEDPGSGYAVGQAGLRAVAEAFDGGADTAIRSLCREHCGIDTREQLIHRVYQDDFDVQSVAPLVVDAARHDDTVASEILATQADGLADQAEWVLKRAEAIKPRMTLLGGMVQNDHYARVLRRTLGDRFPEWSVSLLEDEPVVGALRRARRL